MCSYCIVPSTRGREVSRPAPELLAEVGALAAEGVREVTLLGQNVNSYGRDLRGAARLSFAELLRGVDAIEGIERVRYTSPHPKDIREDVIAAHAECPSVCEHIHLPLQAGSKPHPQGDAPHLQPRALPRPRRADPRAPARRGADHRHHRRLPGESEADFEQTLEVCEQVGYDSAFTFIFSPRRGTAAAELDGMVPHPVKVERMQRLVEVVQRRARERSQRFVGRTMEVLVEGTSRTDASRLRGRISHNKAVNFEGTATAGEIVAVEIESASSATLIGSERLLSRSL